MADETIVPKKKGAMSVSEAGRKGGQTVRDKYGHAFYEEIGKKGGHKVRSLIEEGKKAALEAQKVPSEGTPVSTEAPAADRTES